MQRLFSLLVICLLSLSLFSQNNSYQTAADSDPAALKIVRAIKAKYEGYNTLQADFRLDIEFPGQAVETQKGQLSRNGDKFHFKLATQEGISDGKAIYVIMHDNKSVNIENMPEPGDEAGMLTPQNLLTFYDEDKFVFALQGEQSEGGKTLQVIELKPVDRDASEFTKIRMLVDKSKQQVVRLLAFSRDGSRFTFHLDRLKTNTTLPAGLFAFDKADYEGYYIEDLRF